jgi:hypothetical protein
MGEKYPETEPNWPYKKFVPPEEKAAPKPKAKPKTTKKP